MPEIAHRAFQWVLFSFEPLSSDALVAFVSRDMADGKTEHADLDIHDVLDACCNLLDVDKDSELCRFSHLSVQEYLEEHRYQADKYATVGSSHDGLAVVTIQCLLEKNDPNVANEKLTETSSLRYAAKFWHLHARKSYNINISERLKGCINMMFSKEFSTAYSNWQCIHNCEEDDSDHYAHPSSSQHVNGRLPGTLYYASRFGFEFSVEKLLREGAKVTREGKLRSPIVAAAVHSHTGVVRQLLDADVSLLIQVEDVRFIMEKIDGDLTDLTETMTVLLESGALHLEEEMSNLGQNLTERITREDAITAAATNLRNGDKLMTILLKKWGSGFYITEDVVKAAAGNSESGDKTMAILFEERGANIPITEDVIKTAAGNKSGDKVIMIVLDKRADIPIIEDVMKTAAKNKYCGDRLITILLRHRGDTPITEDVVKAATGNNMIGDKIIAILLEERGADLPITEGIVAQISRRFNYSVIRLLLDKRGTDVPITEDVVDAAAMNHWSGEYIMTILLIERGADILITEGIVAQIARSFSEIVMGILFDKRRADIPITEEVVEAAASNKKNGHKIMAILIREHAADILLTEGVVEAAARNYSSGEDIMIVLLEERRVNISITEGLVVRVAGRFTERVMMILFDRRGSDIPITEEVVKAAAGNSASGGKIMAILFEERESDIPITEDVVEATARNCFTADEVMMVLLDKRGADIPITERVVKAMVENYSSGEAIMTMLLDKRGAEVPLTEDVVKESARNYWVADKLMTVLLNRRGDDIPITDDVIKAATENKNCGDRLVAMLLHHRADVLATQDVDETPAGNYPSVSFTRDARLIPGECEITLPLMPRTIEEPTTDQTEPLRAEFSRYLRAFSSFQSTGYFYPLTIAVSFDPGDIVVVDSMHASGWANGSVLNSGYRGWFPMNYCQTYNEIPMRPLLKALDDLWATLRSVSGSSFRGFGNQDLMRGPNAGVRFLLVSPL